MFGGVVRRLVWTGDEAVNRRDVDDAPPAGVFHGGYEILDELEWGDQHDLDHVGPYFVWEFFDGMDALVSSVVHEDVYSPLDGGGFLCQAFRVCHVREVCADEVSADFVCGFLSGVADVVDDHRCAGFGVHRRDLLSDAASGAGDKRDLPFQGIAQVGHRYLASFQERGAPMSRRPAPSFAVIWFAGAHGPSSQCRRRLENDGARLRSCCWVSLPQGHGTLQECGGQPLRPCRAVDRERIDAQLPLRWRETAAMVIAFTF